MGIVAGLSTFAQMDARVVQAIRTFARAHGKRLDDEWWEEALAAKVPAGTDVGFSPHRDSSAAFALEGVIDGPLGLARWKEVNGFAGMVQTWVPFSFDSGAEPPFWADIRGPDFRLVVGNPVTLLDYWPGGWIGREEQAPYDLTDPYEREQIEYARRARAAYEAFTRGDLMDDHATVAMEYGMLRLLSTAWNSKLVATVSW